MSLSARAALAFALWMSLMLGGCANFEQLRADISGKPVANAVPPPEPELPAQPDVYTLEVQAPEPLRTVLAKHLDLARFRDARVAGAVTKLELDRLIAAAPAQARALAETEGFFDAEATVTRDRAEVPRVQVVVVPGPRARIDEVGLAIEGPLLAAEQAGDANAIDIAAMLAEQWPLSRGEPFTQAAWAAAKSSTLARLQGAGYPLASWRSTSATVDTATRRVALHLVAESGPLFRLGTLRIVGVSRFDEAVVHNLLDFTPGEPYTEALLAQWQRHLQRSELFEAAVVELEVDPAKADAATVIVTLREFQKQQITVGVGYSSDTDARATLDYMHRRPFGWNVVVTNKLEVGREKNAWTGQVISHPLPDHYRDLVSAGYERLDQDNELRTSSNLRLGRNQDTDEFGRQYFVALQQATVESAAPTTKATALSLNYNWVTRRIDSIALPTDGIVYAFETAGGYSFRTSTSDGVFARALGRVTGYRPLGAGWNLQWRLEAGEVFAKTDVTIPDTLLFRAGGQDSVRGYAYRTLGPLENGVVTSGRMLFTSSVELARPISSQIPSLWAAVFVDAGNASNSWNDMRPVVGVGPGIRWRSPVGALRVDMAYAVDLHKWRLEVSLGIAP
jgi:translocation and assembly module TamA